MLGKCTSLYLQKHIVGSFCTLVGASCTELFWYLIKVFSIFLKQLFPKHYFILRPKCARLLKACSCLTFHHIVNFMTALNRFIIVYCLFRRTVYRVRSEDFKQFLVLNLIIAFNHIFINSPDFTWHLNNIFRTHIFSDCLVVFTILNKKFTEKFCFKGCPELSFTHLFFWILIYKKPSLFKSLLFILLRLLCC